MILEHIEHHSIESHTPTHPQVLIPVIATLQECASAPEYRQLIRSSGMIQFVVKNLNSENQELQMHCAYAIFKVTYSLVYFPTIYQRTGCVS